MHTACWRLFSRWNSRSLESASHDCEKRRYGGDSGRIVPDLRATRRNSRLLAMGAANGRASGHRYAKKDDVDRHEPLSPGTSCSFVVADSRVKEMAADPLW